MCGVVGIFHNNNDKMSKLELVRHMISTLVHRGPDGWGIYISNHIALGNTRLSIIDIKSGDQPMVSDRYVISFNGEIYNHIELRKEMKDSGVIFSTTSDTEVILKAFETYGYKALAKFNGQFSFILWDKKDKKVIIARDRYGIRPLYILRHKGDYFFSSEIKGFDVIKGFNREYNVQNLFEHALIWNTIDDDTVFKNIRSLPAGTFEIYEYGKSPIRHRYYEIGESCLDSPKAFTDANEIFCDLLQDSVKLRLRSDVPVGCYLSGGIDSSVVALLIHREKQGCLKTFSVTFSDKDFDERSYQNEMVESIRSAHSSIEIDYEMIDREFHNAAYHFERPVFRTAAVPLYLLSKEVRNSNIKVVLTGEGADEILYGYDSYKELKVLEIWSRQPNSNLRPLLLKKLYPHLKYYSNPRKFGMIRMFYEEFLNDFNNNLVGLNVRAYNNKILSNFFNKDFHIEYNKQKLLDRISSILPENFNTWSLLQKNQFLQMKTLLSGYLLSSQGDRMSMAHSVEGRYPFLDHRLVEKLFYFNDSYKLHGFSQKHILRKAFKGTIPNSIIDRSKTPYQAPDLKSFIRNCKLSEHNSFFLSKEMLTDSGIFNEKYVARFLKKYETGIPQEIGYRDNMIISFLLSTQIIYNRIKNAKARTLDESKRKVFIVQN